MRMKRLNRMNRCVVVVGFKTRLCLLLISRSELFLYAQLSTVNTFSDEFPISHNS